jgi:F-type H+-transporting ATPase subunit epsilon
MKTFQAEILTPQKVFLSGAVQSLVLNGALGYFGVLAGHVPMIARLKPGKLEILREGKKIFYQAGAGFVRITKHSVSVLLEEVKEATA